MQTIPMSHESHEPPLEVRNLRFDLSTVPRYWHGGRRAVSIFFDNLSVMFPEGERFFVASVQAHRAFAKDPRLAADVRAFSGQEGVHSREHVRYNAMVAAHGYPVEKMERGVTWLLAGAKRFLPRRRRLAVTCALEHFTALMGHFILADEGLLEGAHPAMAELWRWHAAEENEHKSVAYDLFQAAGGTYFERTTVMVLASVIFWAKVLEQQARMMSAVGIGFSVREWASVVRFLFIEPGGMLRLTRFYFDYFRPTFHPRDIDSTEILEAWKRVAGVPLTNESPS